MLGAPPLVFYWLALLGAGVAAASGALAAGRRGLDWIGVLVLAWVTAVGGGTLRDLLLDRHPVFWIADPAPLWVALGAVVLTLAYVRFRQPPWRALLVADALGLAFFALNGAGIAQARGMPGLIVVVMGVLTGVAGGVVRDVLSNEVPLLFRPTETLYATAALAGIVGYLGLEALGLPRTPAALAGMLVVLGLRLAAIFWRWHLPGFDVPPAPPA